MAFAYAVSGTGVQGNLKIKYGTFTNATTDTGGAIVTGLNYIASYNVNYTSHTGSPQPKCTVSGGSLTIVTEPGTDGTWSATGK